LLSFFGGFGFFCARSLNFTFLTGSSHSRLKNSSYLDDAIPQGRVPLAPVNELFARVPIGGIIERREAFLLRIEQVKEAAELSVHSSLLSARATCCPFFLFFFMCVVNALLCRSRLVDGACRGCRRAH
jgi:hypothetical protein